MLRNEWYLDEPDLVEERRRCRRLLDEFNATAADQDAAGLTLLSTMLGRFGDESVVLPRFHCSYGWNVFLGRNVFVNVDALFMDDAAITVGDATRIGPRVQLLTALHPLDDHERRRAGWERPLPITLGDNVWLGGGVIVCPGVTVGDNSVIGAGSVVTRDIADHTLAVGNPARPIRQLRRHDAG